MKHRQHGRTVTYVTRDTNTQLEKRSGQTEGRKCRGAQNSATNAYNCTSALNNNNKSNSNAALPAFAYNIKRRLKTK